MVRVDDFSTFKGEITEELTNIGDLSHFILKEERKIESKKLKNREGTVNYSNDEPIRVEKKVGRNEPCPCGSGKKYKKCCLKNHNYKGLYLCNYAKSIAIYV